MGFHFQKRVTVSFPDAKIRFERIYRPVQGQPNPHLYRVFLDDERMHDSAWRPMDQEDLRDTARYLAAEYEAVDESEISDSEPAFVRIIAKLVDAGWLPR